MPSQVLTYITLVSDVYIIKAQPYTRQSVV
jgi:hypothetical protein